MWTTPTTKWKSLKQMRGAIGATRMVETFIIREAGVFAAQPCN